MKRIRHIGLCFTICAVFSYQAIAYADCTLEYLVKRAKGSDGVTQTVAIKDEQIMVKAAGGDKNLDLLYRKKQDHVVVIDHVKRTLMTVDERGVSRINQQIENIQPILRVVGEQVADLSPEQREKWQEILGENVPLDKIAKAAEPQAPIRLAPAGTIKVSGINCQKIKVVQGKKHMADISLANPADMKITEKDSATIRGLFSLYERLAAKSRGLTSQLGITLPSLSGPDVMGRIPIEYQELSGKNNSSASLRSINRATVSAETMKIPKGYKASPLTLWQ